MSQGMTVLPRRCSPRWKEPRRSAVALGRRGRVVTRRATRGRGRDASRHSSRPRPSRGGRGHAALERRGPRRARASAGSTRAGSSVAAPRICCCASLDDLEDALARVGEHVQVAVALLDHEKTPTPRPRASARAGRGARAGRARAREHAAALVAAAACTRPPSPRSRTRARARGRRRGRAGRGGGAGAGAGPRRKRRAAIQHGGARRRSGVGARGARRGRQFSRWRRPARAPRARSLHSTAAGRRRGSATTSSARGMCVRTLHGARSASASRSPADSTSRDDAAAPRALGPGHSPRAAAMSLAHARLGARPRGRGRSGPHAPRAALARVRAAAGLAASRGAARASWLDAADDGDLGAFAHRREVAHPPAARSPWRARRPSAGGPRAYDPRRRRRPNAHRAGCARAASPPPPPRAPPRGARVAALRGRRGRRRASTRARWWPAAYGVPTAARSRFGHGVARAPRSAACGSSVTRRASRVRVARRAPPASAGARASRAARVAHRAERANCARAAVRRRPSGRASRAGARRRGRPRRLCSAAAHLCARSELVDGLAARPVLAYKEIAPATPRLPSSPCTSRGLDRAILAAARARHRHVVNVIALRRALRLRDARSARWPPSRRTRSANEAARASWRQLPNALEHYHRTSQRGRGGRADRHGRRSYNETRWQRA